MSVVNQAGQVLDLIVIGGGINGAGIAADAAGRGLSVGLYEAMDYASATSSASSKLIHGGLRYLEHYEFRLVSEALAEREVLLKMAPHIAFPMRFRLPHRPYLRPAWMIRCGLFLYDHLGHRTSLPASHKVDLSLSGFLKEEMKTGFEYSDCWVDDARLVVLNILAARENGAETRNYCMVKQAVRQDGLWRVTIQDQLTGEQFERTARALVNAAGPWVQQFFEQHMQLVSPRHIRLVKGSHLVVPKIHAEEQAYILQNQDGRIVFVIPYLDQFSIIGTTDIEYHGDPRDVVISEEETSYLLDIVNQHFCHQLQRDDVIWTYSGVRPLCDDESNSPQAITRDYTIELDHDNGQAPLLSVFGGKLTTYRKLGEAAMDKLNPFFESMGKPWTSSARLPGGNFSCPRQQLSQTIHQQYPWLDESMVFRYVTQFGTNTWQLLADKMNLSQMGTCFADGVYQSEIDYVVQHEQVRKGEDFLWRRTKLGLSLNEDEQVQVTAYIERFYSEQRQKSVLKLVE
ncbi:glycerol-3-phosphate dehydrogenase [Vibrio quintilis]|uniref:Glycerol-3-phosphate dehydrogenase n=1 Tax=Vibrio quintilis TaxID=1117707 RepID=A0A1M7YXX0_9VIBR|nr:glycerol-3-phosphate dehydrogenase [Vibrio quintilis]SHO57412.1 Aerobic glycerol-3-phosphate dehydrogenase [Vibrio quintilis]